jgi:hypothetical protein
VLLALIVVGEGELSVKGFLEDNEWNEGADFNGSLGKIWGGILVEANESA